MPTIVSICECRTIVFRTIGEEEDLATMGFSTFQTEAQAHEWGHEFIDLYEGFQEMSTVDQYLPWLQSAQRWLDKWYMGSNIPDGMDLYLDEDIKEKIKSVERKLSQLGQLYLETRFPNNVTLGITTNLPYMSGQDATEDDAEAA